jgi:hypothetical protein
LLAGRQAKFPMLTAHRLPALRHRFIQTLSGSDAVFVQTLSHTRTKANSTPKHARPNSNNRGIQKLNTMEPTPRWGTTSIRRQLFVLERGDKTAGDCPNFARVLEAKWDCPEWHFLKRQVVEGS